MNELTELSDNDVMIVFSSQADSVISRLNLPYDVKELRNMLFQRLKQLYAKSIHKTAACYVAYCEDPNSENKRAYSTASAQENSLLNMVRRYS